MWLVISGRLVTPSVYLYNSHYTHNIVHTNPSKVIGGGRDYVTPKHRDWQPEGLWGLGKWRPLLAFIKAEGVCSFIKHKRLIAQSYPITGLDRSWGFQGVGAPTISRQSAHDGGKTNDLTWLKIHRYKIYECHIQTHCNANLKATTLVLNAITYSPAATKCWFHRIKTSVFFYPCVDKL
jgi:hypothetical protein